MARGKNFVDRSEFAEVVEGIRTQQDEKYQDVDLSCPLIYVTSTSV